MTLFENNSRLILSNTKYKSMQKVIRGLLTLLVLIAAQSINGHNYKYLNTNDGLSSRRVYSIVQDRQGYIWFLTHNGIDRYDGRNFVHYDNPGENVKLDSYANTAYMCVDDSGNLLYISQDGLINKYNYIKEDFDKLFSAEDIKLDSDKHADIYNVFVDNDNMIWLTSRDRHYILNSATHEVTALKGDFIKSLRTMCRIDDNTYYMCSSSDVYKVRKDGDEIRIIGSKSLKPLSIDPYCIYYYKPSNTVIIGTHRQGLCFYYPDEDYVHTTKISDADIRITKIRYYDENNILVATDAVGVYSIDPKDMSCHPYAVADYRSPNKMNGNVINDVYVDAMKRIWIANFPIGVTILDNRLPDYDWIMHYNGNSNSLVDNNVNRIIEDSEGDIWFATNNGISLYNRRTGRWRSVLSTFDEKSKFENHIFLTLCEVRPGEIWAGGFFSGLYSIDKRTMTCRRIKANEFKGNLIVNKYVNAIYTEDNRYVWSGGFYDLKRLDVIDRSFAICDGLKEINSIVSLNDDYLMVGTNYGLYKVSKKTLKYQKIDLGMSKCSVLSLLLLSDKLFVSVEDTGLIVYDMNTSNYVLYNKENSAFLTNNIYSLIDCKDGNIIAVTENSISKFYVASNTIHNWTKGMGLLSDQFNISSGLITSDSVVMVGSSEGVISFKSDVVIPNFKVKRLVFNSFKVFNEKVYAGEKDSPIEKDINEISSFNLSYKRNSFSMVVSTIDYDFPLNTVFRWRLEGHETAWNTSFTSDIIQYSDLKPGKYRLVVRSYSRELAQLVEERVFDITIDPPFWKTIWAYIIYVILFIAAVSLAIYLYLLRKDKEETRDKMNFFTNTAHDIRTPLTLIKTPIDDIINDSNVDSYVKEKLSVAAKGVNSVLRMVSNLIDFEKESNYGGLNLSFNNIDEFINTIMNGFMENVMSRNIKFTFESGTKGLSVNFDRAKLESIVKNIISNAVKYTPDNGSITVTTSIDKKNWYIQVRDTGIGIKKDELGKLFNMYFRGSNAINAKITGSGVGLLFTKKLVKKHKGRISVTSELDKGTEFTVSFPLNIKGNSVADAGNLSQLSDLEEVKVANVAADKKNQVVSGDYTILIVEDNDELRKYLADTFSASYRVEQAVNGIDAWNMLENVNPDLVISDVMMPEMDGKELCMKIKSNLSTSHIPVVLLTALSNNENIIQGLSLGADEYVTKPFDINILALTVKNLLRTRDAFRKFLNNITVSEDSTSGEVLEREEEDAHITPLDRDFISKIKLSIENNMDNSDYTVDTLCSDVSMSRTSLYNKLKALTGESPQDYVRNIRLNHAAMLLKKGEYNITEVAYMTGFRDAKYFREVFKKYYGMTPSQYIKD